jgi:hypothetical protein
MDKPITLTVDEVHTLGRILARVADDQVRYGHFAKAAVTLRSKLNPTDLEIGVLLGQRPLIEVVK